MPDWPALSNNYAWSLWTTSTVRKRCCFPLSTGSKAHPPRFVLRSMRLPLQVLEQEHHIADQTPARVRHLSNGFTKPDSETGAALRASDADLREHMRLKNDELFSRVLA